MPSPDFEPIKEEKERPALQQLKWDTEAELKQQGASWSWTEYDGEGLFMAYAPPGAMGISK